MSDAAWDKLPHDPRGFFELSDPFDEKDLRRSYNRWLRVYKPERFPAEFQRLRAAYEHLAAELRYLENGGAPQHQASEPIAKEPTTGRAPTAPAPEPQRPEELFAVLRDRRPRSASDCVRLALLADVVDVPDRGTFESWLLEGLRVGRRQLLQLAHAYAQTDAARNGAATFLDGLARLGDPVVFGFVGEQLLLEQLRTLPFGQFASLHDQCLRRVGDDDHPACAALRLAVFRAALFVAPSTWIDEQWQALSRVRPTQAPPGFDEELEFAEHLLRYVRVRDSFANGAPLLRQIDTTLAALARGGPAADTAFLDLQLAIGDAAADLPALLADEDTTANVALAALSFHAVRTTEVREAVPGDALRRARELVHRIDNVARRSIRCVLPGLGLLLVNISALWLVFVAALLIRWWQPPTWGRIVLVLGAALLGLVACLWSVRHPRGLRERVRRRQYRSELRGVVADVIVHNQLPLDVLWDALVRVKAPLQTHSAFVLPMALNDVSLAYLSLAQRLS